MFGSKPEPVELNDYRRIQRNRKHLRPIGRPAQAPRRARSAVKRSSAWRSTALFSLTLLLVFAIALAYHAYQYASDLQRELARTRGQVQMDLQEMRAGVQFDSQRQRLLLGVRDEILRVNEEVSLGEAYHEAEVLLRMADKYATVDPLLLLSIGIVESGFDARAKSPANARGLYQLWPSTARMLAGMLGWEYSDEMLYDVDRNTELAALYLDVLLTTYNDLGMVLAEYNGGPINAGYYRAGSHKTAPETADYVPKVLEQYARLVKELPMASVRSVDLDYRDATREGKRLVPARAD
jgi:soluble lytic murein transglycosylase-like protein